jgi:hypothetical protein
MSDPVPDLKAGAEIQVAGTFLEEIVVEVKETQLVEGEEKRILPDISMAQMNRKTFGNICLAKRSKFV